MAALSLDKAMLQDVLQKNSEAGSQETYSEVPDGSILGRRETRVSLRSTAPLSLGYYRSHRDPQITLRQRIRDLAQSRMRFGYRRILLLLKRDG